MLGIDKAEVDNVTTQFNFRVAEIKSLEPAEVNQEFYEKIFGEGNVADEAEFRTKISEDMSNMFSRDSDRMFQRDVSEQLLEEAKLTLPDEFLKRWIVATNDKPVSEEEINSEYDGYSKGLQWQLIKNQLIGDNDLKVENEEVMAYTKGMIASQYAQYGLPAPEEADLEEVAKKSLSNADERRRIIDTLFDHKVIGYIKENGGVESKEVSYDEFVKLASGPE